MRDVEVGVEPQLGQPPGRAQGPVHQLVTQQPVGRVQRLRRSEQVLCELEPLTAERLAGRLDRRERCDLRAALAGRGVGEHGPLASPRNGDVQALAQTRAPGGVIVGRQRLMQQRIRNRLGVECVRARKRGAQRPSTKT